MNRSIYKRVRRCIRDNGMRYTLHVSRMTGDTDAMLLCDELANVWGETDELALRQAFTKHERPAVAFMLTCMVARGAA